MTPLTNASASCSSQSEETSILSTDPIRRFWEGEWTLWSHHTSGMFKGASVTSKLTVSFEDGRASFTFGGNQAEVISISVKGLVCRVQAGGNDITTTLTPSGEGAKGTFSGKHIASGKSISGTYEAIGIPAPGEDTSPLPQSIKKFQGKVTGVIGEVWIIRGGYRTGSSIQLKEGVEIKPGDLIESSPRGRARIDFGGDEPILIVYPETKMAVRHHLQAVEKRAQGSKNLSTYELIIGKIKAFTGRIFNARAIVITANAACGIRGTEFIVSHDPDAMEDVYLVKKGTIEIEGVKTGKVLVNPGEMVKVNNGTVGQVQPFTQAFWDQMEEPELLSSLKQEKGWLGLGGRNMTDEEAHHAGFEKNQGVLVVQLSQDGPAEKAGIRSGDILLTFEGYPVESAEDFLTMVQETLPGTKVEIGFLRGRFERTVTVIMGSAGL